MNLKKMEREVLRQIMALSYAEQQQLIADAPDPAEMRRFVTKGRVRRAEKVDAENRAARAVEQQYFREGGR